MTSPTLIGRHNAGGPAVTVARSWGQSINVKAKAEKPPASVKTTVKKSAKLPVEIPSAGQREVQGIESNMEAKESQSE
jgi:hypothetical protein